MSKSDAFTSFFSNNSVTVELSILCPDKDAFTTAGIFNVEPVVPDSCESSPIT